mgnify:CR=1 FL=1
MELAAEELRFEKAAQLRDRIRSIQLLSTRQKAVAGSLADTDVVGYHRARGNFRRQPGRRRAWRRASMMPWLAKREP